MHDNDPVEKALKLWQVNPPIDPNLAYKVRQLAEKRRENLMTFFLWKKEWSTAAICLTALVVSVAGLTGSIIGKHQKVADRQAIVSLYLARIDPLRITNL